MDDKAYASLLNETSDFLIKALHKSFNICDSNPGCCCCSCPLYDENMGYSYGTRCFSILLADYAEKLSIAAKNLEEKGE